MTSRELRLPDGKLTDDAAMYREQWEKLSETLTNKLNVHVVVLGFSRGVIVSNETEEGTVILPMWLVGRIWEFMK